MTRSASTILLFAAVTGLTGCSGFRESNWNPTNWFGGRNQPEMVSAEAPPADTRPLVAQVTALAVNRNSQGVIVNATGLPPTQGWWDASLVPASRDEPVDGVMTFDFVVLPPPAAQRTSTPQSREVTAGAFLSNIKLQQIRTIVVRGATNSRSARN